MSSERCQCPHEVSMATNTHHGNQESPLQTVDQSLRFKPWRARHRDNVTRLVWTGGGHKHGQLRTHSPIIAHVTQTVNVKLLHVRTHTRDFISLERTSKAVYNASLSLLRNLFLLVLLQCLCILPVLCQGPLDTCKPDLDCHPPSQNLVDLSIPGRTLEVSSTCGTPAGTTTVYRKSSATLDFTDFYCNGTYPHPKDFMTDQQNQQVLNFVFENPKLNTYWQSQNTIVAVGRTPSVEYIVFNLTEPLLVRFIRAIFISPHILSPTDNSDMRPIAMVIEKRSTADSDWEPLRYYAENCYFYFGTGVLWQKLDGTGPSYDAKTPVCEQIYFSGDTTTFTGWGFGRQEVVFNPSREYMEEFARSAVIQRHYMAAALRLRLLQPSNAEPLSSYYAVADLEVDGQCSCFGHASICAGPNDAQCVCNHNTMGENCESCLPLYNNRPWRPGAAQQANACEDCGCGGFATSCQYDPVKGYGVCANCTDHTTGDKCQFCVRHFYVNPTNASLITQPICSGSYPGFNGIVFITYPCDDYCIPCNCSQVGSNPSSGYSCQNATGQCSCKAHTAGRDCGICADEYWNITASNPQGCIPCVCERSGTYNNSLLCDKTTGACVCKNNTEGRTCNQCKDKFYGLSLVNDDGCLPCDCDAGGSTNSTCPASSGTCPCRPDLAGRTCQNPRSGYYVPLLDHLTFDAEFSPKITEGTEVVERAGQGELTSTVTGRGFVKMMDSSRLDFLVKVPRTQQYHVILRYETDALWLSTQISLVATNPGQVSQYRCGTTTVSTASTLSLVMTLRPATLRGSADFGLLCLQADLDYDLRVEIGTGDPRNSFVLLDSVVLLPDLADLTVFRAAGPETRAAIQSCFVATTSVALETRANQSCAQYEYSAMAELYNGALGCTCIEAGSNSTVCDPYSGQCPCKPGVMLLDCRQCLVDHYGFSSGQGCLPCDCDPRGSVRTACNNTGLCECKNNVEGDKCDSCISEHYGLFTGNGCQQCTCNPVYSVNASCMDTGQCYCKPGVGGQNCDACLDGYFNLTGSGCTPCGCSTEGSTSTICDKLTGKCSCKGLAIGDQCDQCQPGYFALGNWSPLGCLACYCSSHSTECESASGWFLTTVSNDWSLLQGITAVEQPWTAVTGTGVSVEVIQARKLMENEAQFVMQVINDGANLAENDIFLVATDDYLGNKQSAYMHNLSFSLAMSVPEPPPNQTQDIMLVSSTLGDVILENEDVNFKLVLQLPEPPGVNITYYTFQLRTDLWYLNTVAGTNPTYTQMIQVLADLSAIKIRAKYSNVSGTEVDLYEAMLTYAVNTNISGIPVNNVENCTCPKEYTGQFCEQCAPGYTRLTPGGGPYSQCIPCNCYGHEVGVMPCDPETGVCNCGDNTAGRTCQICQDGYYGDATRGTPDSCKPCSCPGDVIAGDVNVFAMTCTLGPLGLPECVNCTVGHGGATCEVCVAGWYGVPTDPTNNDGQCARCECNGRANTCNTTSGFCESCTNNTAGKECDICAPSYYGNALLNDCRGCGCQLVGSTGDCDHRTGACDCRQNVIGFACDECGPNSYNYSSGEGCLDCDCHPVGSLDRQCDVVSGQCVCRTHLVGRRCDACEDTYWNINPSRGCDPCDCDPRGTLNVTSGPTFGTCDLVTGQCTCALPGIIGRTCDVCAPGTKETYTYVQGIYIGTYPDCELCGECFDNWAAKIDSVGVDIDTQYRQALYIWSHYGNMTVEELVPIISNLSANITMVQSSIDATSTAVHQLRDLQQRYDQLDSNVTAYTDQVAAAEGLLRTAESALSVLRAASGTVLLPGGGGATTPALLNELSRQAARQQRDVSAAANASWSSVQNLTEAVRLSNGSVRVFVTRVQAAVRLVQDASSVRTDTEIILSGSFTVEHANNSAELRQALRPQVEALPAVVVNAQRLIEQAMTAATSANVTIDEANGVVNLKLAENEAKHLESQITKFNATQAQQAAGNAQGVVNILEVVANHTKGNMTQALADVITGLEVIDDLQVEVALLDRQSQEVRNAALRPLSALVTITSEIESTAVSPVDVQRIFDRADRTLRLASLSINVTETAAEEAERTLEMVRTIRHSLDTASLQRNQTRGLVILLIKYNSTILGTAAAVETKATSATQLSQATQRNVRIYETEINAIYRCFQDKQQRSAEWKRRAEQAQTSALAARQVHLENLQTLQTITATTSAMEGTYNLYLEGLLQVQDQFTILETDLGVVSGTNSIEVLLNEYMSQKTEMDAIMSELQSIGSQVDTLQVVLEALDPNTVTCRLGS